MWCRSAGEECCIGQFVIWIDDGTDSWVIKCIFVVYLRRFSRAVHPEISYLESRRRGVSSLEFLGVSLPIPYQFANFFCLRHCRLVGDCPTFYILFPLARAAPFHCCAWADFLFFHMLIKIMIQT